MTEEERQAERPKYRWMEGGRQADTRMEKGEGFGVVRRWGG